MRQETCPPQSLLLYQLTNYLKVFSQQLYLSLLFMLDFHKKDKLMLLLCSVRLRLTGSCGQSTSGCLSPSMCRRPYFRGSQDSSAPSRHWKKARPTLQRTRPQWMNASAFSSKESMCSLFDFGSCSVSSTFYMMDMSQWLIIFQRGGSFHWNGSVHETSFYFLTFNRYLIISWSAILVIYGSKVFHGLYAVSQVSPPYH